ncbi:MAG: LytR family transcriptional regulator [Actinobacteria bacterium]|nr:MAG: LytR family transcriptional regulator [Actinomycetota bacterium]
MNKARGCFITILIIFILVVFVFLFVSLMDSEADGNGKDILILGIDEREGRNDFKGRTDTIIIYHISSWGKKDSLISIPRDIRVQLEGYGWNKINAAYVYGGEEMIKQEIYELTGIEIDRVMIINFNGFKRIIDILGGIEIVVEEPLHDELSGADFDPGTYTMSGEQALSFARCRATARADIDRIDRQQYLLNEIIRQKFNFSMITKTPQIIKVLSSETRSDFTIWDFCSTGFVLLFSSKDINRITIPTKSAMIDDVSYQIADEDEVKEFLSGYLK